MHGEIRQLTYCFLDPPPIGGTLQGVFLESRQELQKIEIKKKKKQLKFILRHCYKANMCLSTEKDV